MDDTEDYLNNILQKRMGSIPNYGAFSKTGNAVTRIPKKEEKLESMPTVFRQKHQTVYRASQLYNSQNPILKSSTSLELQGDLEPKKRESTNQQRVEYMVISKRIDGKESSNFKAPTVDVSKYRKTEYVPPQSVPLNDVRESSKKNLPANTAMSSGQSSGVRSSQALSKRVSTHNDFSAIQEEEIQSESQMGRSMASREGTKVDGSKRRKIFGQSREKY